MTTSHQPVLGPGFALPSVAAVGGHRRRAVPRKRLLTWAASVVVGLFAVAAVCLAGALAVFPAVTGGHTLTVLSGSMAPAISTGSVVVTIPVRAGDVAVGDIVTYSITDPATGQDTLVTHRVVGIDRIGGAPVFTTKGDANGIADASLVTGEQLRGKVAYDVPLVGTVRDAVFTESGAMYAAAAAMLILGLSLLRGIGRSASAATPAKGAKGAKGRRERD
jgi:signal peptidase